MMTLVREGGVPILFVIVLGLCTLLSALAFAFRPAHARLRWLVWMHGAVLFATFAGTCANLGATFHYLADGKQGQNDRALVLLQGLAESMSTPILGFAFLALSALCVAVGVRRVPNE